MFKPGKHDNCNDPANGGFVNCVIGEGSFLERSVKLYRHSCLPEYVIAEYIPKLQELFLEMGIAASQTSY